MSATTKTGSEPEGFVLVDKPRGLTSHDVVALARKALGTRAVGHAGTLDPMATGLLVVLVGRATKLSSWLTADDKRYLTTVRFGEATASLDADGAVTETAPVAERALDPDALRATLASMEGASMQVPPAVSAIKVDGVAMHERTRRGETVALDARPVTIHRAALLGVRREARELDLDLHVSKGFYVRAFGRDLAAALGTVGHLTALRRVASGAMTVGEALDGAVLQRAKADEAARADVKAALRPVSDAARWMPSVTVDEAAATALGHGKRVASEGDDGVLLVLGPDGDPVCVAERREGALIVARGMK
ncbi:MAG: tRNA pseudouridine(55) synthase TruB [Polyangiales bacterium]